MIKVRAKTSTGAAVDVDVHAEDTFASLRTALAHATRIAPELLRVIHKGQLLVPGMRVADLNLRDGDVLVVLKGRTKPELPAPDPTPEPDPVTIRQAIAQRKGVDEDEEDDDEDLDDKVPLQELLNSFFGNFFAQPPAGAAAFAPAPAIPATPAVNIEPPAEAVAQLTEMGFTEAQARRALRLNRMSIPQATDWLLEHADDPEPAAGEGEAERAEGGERREGEGEGGERASGPAVVGEGGGIPVPLPPLFQGNRASAEQRLLEMGFSSEDVARALRATGNNYEAACAMLVGEGDEDNPLDEDSPIVGAIFNNPVVSAGLSNPRVMEAFRAMVEDPTTVANYINDPEVGPLILQVHSILQGLNPNS